VENLEEEVVMLREKVDKINTNVEKEETSTSSFEENPSSFLEINNEETPKTYAEVLKGMNHGQLESKKINKDTSSRRPSTFKPQRRINNDHPRKEFKRTTPFTPRYVNLFYGHYFYCTNFGHKVADCRVYERSVQTRNACVAPHNIECYKFHNYGHIDRKCRSMTVPSIKKETNIIYKKVWKRKNEEQVNKDQVLEITILEIIRDEDKSTKKKEDVKYRKVWRRNWRTYSRNESEK
jgi:hypothetical protein